MSYRDVMTMGGNKNVVLNIQMAVGIKNENNRRIFNASKDVMLIQAMFGFIKKYDNSAPFSRAVQFKDLPSVNGTFNNQTANMIEVYQQANAQILLKVDGIIEPAHYYHRNIVFNSKHGSRRMTITALDIDCSTAAIQYYGAKPGDHIKAIKNEYPQLSFL